MSETLETLRIRERDMELEAIALRARVEELRSIIAILEHAEQGAPRRRQRKGDHTVVDLPGGRVMGGAAETPARPGLPWEDEDTAA